MKNSWPPVRWLRLFALLPLAALAAEPRMLTLKEARELAIQNHPRISVADLRALAARQTVQQARSGYFPTLTANATAVGASQDNTRLAAGAINNPSVFERNAEGLSLTQIITDFGRTDNLTEAAKLRARAEATNALATRAQVEMQVDVGFFAAQQAHSVLRVAQQTVDTRQLLFDQVNALASNKLRSDLDVSFAQVNLADAKLLLERAQNDLEATFTQLTAQLGLRERQPFILVEEPVPDGLPTNVDGLVSEALHSRPELARLRLERDAAGKFAKAEKALHYPTISAVAGAGVIPIHDSRLEDYYAAAGVNLSLPLFAGGLYSARQREAELRARAAEDTLREEENNVIRDVRVAWLRTTSALERIRITAQLAQYASRAFDLAQTRYKTGTSSIVELSRAQLNKTSAEIAEAAAKYEYLTQRSILEFQAGRLK